MDDTKTLNPSLSGSPGDLWKKVLDEVQTDAAARRSKAAARSLAGDKRGGGGVDPDLLKRILLALETRREDDQQAQRIEQLSQRLEQVMAAVQNAPRPDHSAVPGALAALGQQVAELSQKLAELTARKDDKPDAALMDALQKVRADVQAIPQAEQLQLRAELAALPKPADVTPKLDAILEAMQAIPQAEQLQLRAELAALPKPADLSPQLKALEAAIAASAAPRPTDPAITAALGSITQQLEALPASLASSLPALPAPVDHTADLKAILDAVRSMPTVDPDNLANRIVEAIERIKPVDPSDLLHQLRADVQAIPQAGQLQLHAALAALPKPVDSTVKLDAILDSLSALKAAPSVDVASLIEQLRTEISALPKATDANAKLDAIFAAIETSPVGSQIQQLRAELAALPKPADSTAKLDAILDSLSALKAAPAVDVAPLIQQLRNDIGALPKPADSTTKLDAILDALSALKAAPAVDLAPHIQELRADISALPRPIDLAPKIDELIALARKPVDDGRDEVLLQILESVQKPHPAYDQRFEQLTAKLNEMSAAVAATAAATSAAPAPAAPAYDERFDQLAAKMNDLSAAIAATAAAVAAAPAPVPAVAPAALEQLNASLAKLPDSASIADAVRSAVAALPKPADLAPQIGSILGAITALAGKPAASVGVDVEAAVQRAVAEALPGALKAQAEALEQMRGEFAGLRDAVKQDVAAQTSSLREELSLRASDVIMQVRTQSQTLREDVNRSAYRLREEMHTTPAAQAAKAVVNDDALKSVVAKLRANPVLVRQEQLLQRLAAASRDNPAHQPDVTRQILGELPRLSEWDAETTKAVEQLLASFGEQDSDDGFGSAPIGTVTATGAGGYSWTDHTPRKSKAVPISIGIAAFIAIGVVIFLVINAMGGKPNPANGNAANPGKDAGAADKARPEPAKAGSADKTKDAAGTVAVTPAPTPAKDGTADAKDSTADKTAKGTFELFPKQPEKGTQTPAAPAIVSQLKNLTEAGIDKTRIHDVAAATQIVFLVHSGSTSPTALASILAELKKALAKVGPHQKFTVVFSEGARFVEAPPHGLREGSDKERAAMESWIDVNIRAPERATLNPLIALDVALSYAPDLLWIVSDGLTGEGTGQSSSKRILDRIATLNPEGQTRIAATQVGPADPAGTLKAIAEKYGGAYAETAVGAVGLK